MEEKLLYDLGFDPFMEFLSIRNITLVKIQEEKEPVKRSKISVLMKKLNLASNIKFIEQHNLFGDGFNGVDGSNHGGPGGFGGGGGGGGGYGRGGQTGGIGAGGGGGGTYGTGGDGGHGGGGGGTGGEMGGPLTPGAGGGFNAENGIAAGPTEGSGGGGGGYAGGVGGLGGDGQGGSDVLGDGGNGGHGTVTTGGGNGGNGGSWWNSGGGGGGGFGGGNGGNGASVLPPASPSAGANGGTTQVTLIDDPAQTIHSYVAGQIGSLAASPGGAGDDILDGGPGNDTLFGMGGSNTFVFNSSDVTGPSDEYDTVYDWSTGSANKIALKTGARVITADKIEVIIAAQTSSGTDRTIIHSSGDNSVHIQINGIGRDLILSDFVIGVYQFPWTMFTPVMTGMGTE